MKHFVFGGLAGRHTRPLARDPRPARRDEQKRGELLGVVHRRGASAGEPRASLAAPRRAAGAVEVRDLLLGATRRTSHLWTFGPSCIACKIDPAAAGSPARLSSRGGVNVPAHRRVERRFLALCAPLPPEPIPIAYLCLSPTASCARIPRGGPVSNAIDPQRSP